jgi:hypothetical protein
MAKRPPWSVQRLGLVACLDDPRHSASSVVLGRLQHMRFVWDGRHRLEVIDATHGVDQIVLDQLSGPPR